METKQPDSYEKWLIKMVNTTRAATTRETTQTYDKAVYVAFKTCLEVYQVFKDTWTDDPEQATANPPPPSVL